MTEFTKEYIRSVRMCSYLIEPPASEVIEHLCDEIEHLVEALQSIFDACMKADEQGELSELISGELLDSVGKLLGYTPENAIKKEREYLEAIKQALNEVKE